MPRAGRRLGGSYVMGATPAGAKHGLDAFSARRTNAPNRSSTRSRGGPPSAEAENGGGRDRTADLKVMSLASYHCSTPQWSQAPLLGENVADGTTNRPSRPAIFSTRKRFLRRSPARRETQTLGCRLPFQARDRGEITKNGISLSIGF